MPAAVVSIESNRRGYWSLLEVAQPGKRPVPWGILLVDQETGKLTTRMRNASFLQEFEEGPGEPGKPGEDELDFLDALTVDFEQKADEMGGLKLLDWLEDSASNYLRISDRSAIAWSNEHAVLDQLFDEHIDSTVQPFVTHLPVYGLRAAATKFGEGMDAEQEGWVRAPEKLRLTERMFVAYVVGRSMEPMIPDGSACIFRAGVTGSRLNRYLLIEKIGETDFAARYTVKKYARQGVLVESAEREQPIRLEPLNPEFEAFEMTADEFRVVAEFVQVLSS
jgi:phage repressor protein C with HTH and peptisase S24 domain